MAFRRRRTEEEASALDPVEETADVAEVSADAEAPVVPERAPTVGPYDLADAPDDDLPRLDLGSLRIPIPDGVEVRLEVDEQSQTIIAAVAVLGANAIQIGAFAAPKTSGIWNEVADEIAQGLRDAGGAGDVTDGPFGRELHARIPMETPGGGRSVQPARFIGVDGPRWFLRGMVQGPAATDPVQARKLEEIFRGVVVVRGGDAMAPRDPLPLQVPRDVAEQMQEAHEHAENEAAQSTENRYAVDPFERGPEITEIR
ncbi:MAG: DUF3710 domain-containing protein [Actinomycetes bacterium]